VLVRDVDERDALIPESDPTDDPNAELSEFWPPVPASTADSSTESRIE